MDWFSFIDDEEFFNLDDRINESIYRHADTISRAVEFFYERFTDFPTRSYKMVWKTVYLSCKQLGISYKDIEDGGRFHPETIFRQRVKAERYKGKRKDAYMEYHKKVDEMIDGYVYRLELIKQ